MTSICGNCNLSLYIKPEHLLSTEWGYETFSKAKMSFGSLIHASYPRPSFEATSVFNICQDCTEDGMYEVCQGKPIETQGLERE